MREYLANITRRLDTLTRDTATITTDMATMRADMAAIKSDIATTKSDIATTKSDIATTKSDIAGLTHDLADVNDTITSMNRVVNPEMLIRPYDAALVPGNANDVVEGAQATFTYVKVSPVDGSAPTYYAAGAAHCALFYGAGPKGQMVVTVPSAVAQGTVAVLAPAKLCSPAHCNLHRYDQVLLELAVKPEVDDGHIPEWMASGDLAALEDQRVAGLSTSGFVTGCNLRFVQQEGYHVFLDERGEPGHSGACVFAHCGGHATIVGTFYGRRPSSSAAMRPRGIVTPPVPVASMIRYLVDPAVAAPSTVQVSAWSGQKVHKLTLPVDAGGKTYAADGKTYSCVVCTAPAGQVPLLVGAATCASLGCGRPR